MSETPNKKRLGLTAWIIIILALTAAGIAYQTVRNEREEERVAAEKIENEARKVQQGKVAAAAEIARVKAEEEWQRERANANPAKLRELISSCQRQISAKLSVGPFAFSFPYYAPDTIRTLADTAAAFGGSTKMRGFPSAQLDDYKFDSTKWNLDRVTGKYPSSYIRFAVEGAKDGYSARRYVSEWSCEINPGFILSEPTESGVIYLN